MHMCIYVIMYDIMLYNIGYDISYSAYARVHPHHYTRNIVCQMYVCCYVLFTFVYFVDSFYKYAVRAPYIPTSAGADVCARTRASTHT